MNPALPIYIVVPIYNASEYIEEFLQSIVSTFKVLNLSNTITIWFCDDASTDTTVQLVKDFFNTSPSFRFEIIEQEKNLGQMMNTIHCIKKLPIPCYCITVDCDMQPAPEIFKSFIPYCLNQNNQLIIGDFNPHNFGVRFIISFLYTIYLSIKTKQNLLLHYGSSFRWFYLDEKLQEKMNNKRLDEILLKHYTPFSFYKINKGYLKNYSQHSFLQLLKNIFRNS